MYIQRQSHRYLEIALLKKLQSNNPEKVKNYRLQVKRRIYKQNYVRFFFTIFLFFNFKVKNRNSKSD